MKYLDEYRDPQLAKDLIEKLRRRTFSRKEIRLMEICGTHTVAIFRSGLKELLPGEIRLISGPGCPVCVTANEDIDRAIWLSGRPGVIIATFGDFARVPGSSSSLERSRSRGRTCGPSMRPWTLSGSLVKIRTGRLSSWGSVSKPRRQLSLRRSGRLLKLGVGNFSVFSAHKLLPPAMRTLLDAGEVQN